MNTLKSTLALLAALAITFGTAWFGSRFPVDEWYRLLQKPAWNPPDWIFGPVWTLLYLLMAIAAWLVWKHAGWSGAAVPLGLFVIQLALNGVWSWLFFGLHRIDLAFIDISVLWLAILLTIVLFWKIRPAAGALLIPYLAWVSFALVLNLRIWQLNV